MKTFWLVVPFFFTLTARANPVSDIIEGMSSADRASTLAQLLRQSGKACSSATRTFKQGADRDGAVYWSVACSNGQSFAIQVANDSIGSTRIMECSLMGALGMECFKRLE